MPNENVIDTLRLDIVVNTKQNGQSITTLRNSLDKLYKFLNGVKDQDFSKISNDIAKIGNSFTPLIKAVNSLDAQGLKNLTSLGTRLKTLNKRMGEIDAKAMAHKFNQMTQAITPFIDKVMSAQEALVALNNVMGGAKTLTKTATPKATTTTTPKATTNTNILGGKLGKSLNFGSMIAKLYFVRNITKQLGQNLAKVVQYGIDYEETLNLWQVAMKGNTAEARKFVTEMNKAYGISEAMLMNYQATFKNMLGALGGIKPEDAYGLSEVLTQMALDYASLYNTSIESAMTKFQAVLAGQVRPIRNESGYDITQATLFEVYKDIGGTKSIRQLTETEKRLLRILAVYRQMKDTAFEDMSRTITSTANQARFMSETVKEIATWIGVGANQWLHQKNTLIRINAYLLALRELAIQFAKNMGYVEPEGEDTSKEQQAADNLLGTTEDTKDAWGGINKQVDEYSEKLLGFDKFQVLTDASTENGSDISLTILEELKKVREEYDKIRKETENVALFGDAEKNIKGAYDILKEWGLELDENGNIVGGFDKIKEKVADIAKTLGALSITILAITQPVLAIALAIEYLMITNEDFRNGLLEIISTLWDVISPLLDEILAFAGEILFAISPLITEILAPLVQLVRPIGKILTDILSLVVNVVKVLSPIISMVAEALNILTPILEIVHGITWLISFSLSSVLKFIMPYIFTLATIFETILKVIETIGEVVRALFQWDWASLGKNLKNIWTDWKMPNAVEIADSLTITPSWKADGGLATKGSLFYAGEAGPELVTQTSGGGSTIMNMKQLEDAVARGFIRGFASTDNGYDNDDTTEVYVDGQRLFNVMRGVAKRNGYDFVRV